MKKWIKRQWTKFKKWVYGLLLSLGLVAGTVIAATVSFTYTPATEYEGGTPMPLSDIEETRLYCDGALVATESGADGDFTVVLGFGSHDCYATHYVSFATVPESSPSNTVTKIVRPTQPSRPENLQ